MDTRTLSKSDFKVARECPTKLFYKESGYPSLKDDDPYLALLARGGYMIEQLAKARYPDGVELGDWRDPVQAWAATAEAIRGGDVTLFEATLLNGRQLARVDILQRRGNTLRLVEIKAKSWDAAKDKFRVGRGGGFDRQNIAAAWRPYLEDVTYQAVLLESLFPEFQVEPVLCLVDKTARCLIDALPEHFEIVHEIDRDGRSKLVTVKLAGDASQLAQEQLTVEIPVRAEVALLRDEVVQATSVFLASYEPALSRLSSPLGTHCKECEYRVPPSPSTTDQRNGFAECWGPLAAVEPSILDLYQVSRLPDADALIARGTVGLLDIPDDVVNSLVTGGPVAVRQRIQIVHTRNRQPYIGTGLRPRLESAAYPLYFLDFEATRSAVPFHTGMRPYGLLAFQWSCHIVDAPGAPLRHREFINVDRAWPNEAFARSLAQAIGPSGTVLTWSQFEANTLRNVREELTERGLLDAGLQAWFAGVEADGRVLDMHKLAASDYFHPGMGGAHQHQGRAGRTLAIRSCHARSVLRAHGQARRSRHRTVCGAGAAGDCRCRTVRG